MGPAAAVAAAPAKAMSDRQKRGVVYHASGFANSGKVEHMVSLSSTIDESNSGGQLSNNSSTYPLRIHHGKR